MPIDTETLLDLADAHERERPDKKVEHVNSLHEEWMRLQDEYDVLWPMHGTHERLKTITARQRAISAEITRIALDALGAT